MQTIADELRASVPCEHADGLLDDLAFWDSMRGFDCLDEGAPTFVRVYAHADSVPQTLVEWEETLGVERAVARGAHWYVIGAPAVIEEVEPPAEAPLVANDVGVPVPATTEHDYVTNCMLYVASEGQRYVEDPQARNTSAKQYGALFPGVAAEVHAAVDELGRDRVLQLADEERWIAALSSIGPRTKARCAAAFRAVGDSVRSFEGGGE